MASFPQGNLDHYLASDPYHVFHFLIGFTDVFVAGRLGKNVQACMGVISQAMFFFLVVAMAVGNGSVAAISQSLGSKLPLRAQRYMGLSLQLGFIFGLIILVGGLLGLDIFLKLLQIPEEIYPIARYLLKSPYISFLPITF